MKKLLISAADSDLYPAQEHEDLGSMVLESIDEHKQVKTLPRDMSRGTPGIEMTTRWSISHI